MTVDVAIVSQYLGHLGALWDIWHYPFAQCIRRTIQPGDAINRRTSDQKIFTIERVYDI